MQKNRRARQNCAGRFFENRGFLAGTKYAVSLRRKASRDALDELSDADLDVLKDVFAKFGKVDQWDLVKYTHRYCREWEDPNGSSAPISYEAIFKALGRTPAEAKKMGARVEQQRTIDKLFADL